MVGNQACLGLQALGVCVQALHLHMHPGLRRVIALDVQVVSMCLQGERMYRHPPSAGERTSVLLAAASIPGSDCTRAQTWRRQRVVCRQVMAQSRHEWTGPQACLEGLRLCLEGGGRLGQGMSLFGSLRGQGRDAGQARVAWRAGGGAHQLHCMVAAARGTRQDLRRRLGELHGYVLQHLLHLHVGPAWQVRGVHVESRMGGGMCRLAQLLAPAHCW